MTSMAPSTQLIDAHEIPDWDDVMAPTYGTPGIHLVRGDRWTVYSNDGRAYTDLLSGIAVSALGHAHPAIVHAVSHQVATLSHTSNLYAHGPGLTLAGRLQAAAGGAHKAFFCNSGTEANEAALKALRLWAHGRGRPGGVVLAFHDGFHGRTFGGLSLTAKPAHRAGFEPLVPQIIHVPFNDVAALQAAFLDHDVVGVFAECIQGEGGVVPMERAFADELGQQCSRAHALLVVDEVQTGIGRTGSFFAYESLGLVPDIITLAKGLGGGLPIGACLMAPHVAALWSAGKHGSTFGGNPIACAAALAVLDTLDKERLVTGAARKGATFMEALDVALKPHGIQSRGQGLLIGVPLGDRKASDVVEKLQAAGYLVGSAGPHTLRFAPPLIIDEATLLKAIPVIRDAIADA